MTLFNKIVKILLLTLMMFSLVGTSVIYFFDKKLEKLNEEKIAAFFLKLDSVYREEMILQTKMDTNYSIKARSKMIQSIVKQENLLFAKYYNLNELNDFIINKSWKNQCSLPIGASGQICYPLENSDQIIGIIPIIIEKELFGYLVKKAKIDNFNFIKQKPISLKTFLIMFGAFITITTFILLYFKMTVTNDLNALVQFMNNDHLANAKCNTKIKEFCSIRESIEKSWNMVAKFERERSQFKTTILIANTARQVAHDIRSPLAALSVATSDLKILPEEQRVLIRSALQRIEDIANDLSSKKGKLKKDIEADEAFPSAETSIELLPSLVEKIVSEKRMQFLKKQGISISTESGVESYGLFAKINLKEFKRVLSNLINNAVEAMEEKGSITVSLKDPEVGQDDKLIQIIVTDNGKGIAKEILPQLMQKGATFGKERSRESGSGIGLYHARESLRSWGGDLKIESEIHCGTRAIIILPKQKAPSWFVSEIKISSKTTQVMILDDDHSIHQVWDGRLNAAGVAKQNVFHFMTGEEVQKWCERDLSTPPPSADSVEMTGDPCHPERGPFLGRSILSSRAEPFLGRSRGISRFATPWLTRDDSLFLFDYELLGSDKTGLDVIEELQIQKGAILVTSHYEEDDVCERCERLGVKLLPKNLAGFVPIIKDIPTEAIPTVIPEPCETECPGTSLEEPDYVLLDDDQIIRSTWKNVAKIRSKKLLIFQTPEELYKRIDAIHKDTKIYIDSNLKDNIKGEHIAKDLFERGYQKLYLATGADPRDFPPMPWLKAIVDKVPPFLK